MRSEREWWGRFEDREQGLAERVTLKEHGETATFGAGDIDFVELVAEEGTPRIVVISATRIRQLEAHWLVLQPELVRADPAKGWEPFGDRFEETCCIGSEEQTTIEFRGSEDSSVCMLRSYGPDVFEVYKFGDAPLELVAFPTDAGGRR